MTERFEWSRRDGSDDLIRQDERWQFIVPHDDDAVLGAGLLLQYAKTAGIATEVLITSDGGLGYSSLSHRDQIADIRTTETRAALATLGVPEPVWLGFPDGRLHHFSGRWRVDDNPPESIGGYTGLQNAFTHHLRRFAPSRVFMCTSADIHPDHQVVHRELLISLFHAAGTIWPELGAPLPSVPSAVEMAVYCAFPSPPDLCLSAGPESLQIKLDAIAAFRSQTQIDRLVARVRDGGPVEYFRTVDFDFYSPATYNGMFQR